MAYSDYIVFVDESGSPVLENPDPEFPIFVLSCVLVRKSVYADAIAPALANVKFATVGHDQLVLHERDIRQQRHAFAFLRTDAALRNTFLAGINAVVGEADIEIAAAVIDKPRLVARYARPWSPYQIAVHFCMETLLARLVQLGQAGRRVHMLFESRGKREDADLALQVGRIAGNQANWGMWHPDFTQLQWEPMFVEKKANSAGLQLADLTARPIGLSVLRPGQANRAYDVLRPKLIVDGLKVFP